MSGLFVCLSVCSCAALKVSLAVVHRLLTALASLDVEHRLQQLQLMGLFAPRHVGFSQTRDQTDVFCIASQILNHWTTKEAPRNDRSWETLCRESQ